MESPPSTPDGILDMIGPRTFDGGYSLSSSSSPPQVMSSAMAKGATVNDGALREGVNAAVVVGMCVVETGANAEARVTTSAMRRMQSLVMMYSFK